MYPSGWIVLHIGQHNGADPYWYQQLGRLSHDPFGYTWFSCVMISSHRAEEHIREWRVGNQHWAEITDGSLYIYPDTDRESFWSSSVNSISGFERLSPGQVLQAWLTGTLNGKPIVRCNALPFTLEEDSYAKQI